MPPVRNRTLVIGACLHRGFPQTQKQQLPNAERKQRKKHNPHSMQRHSASRFFRRFGLRLRVTL